MTGDLSESAGLVDAAAGEDTGAILIESLGFMALAGSIVTAWFCLEPEL